jgi:RNA polymerase sigma factor (sigma-70 family)
MDSIHEQNVIKSCREDLTNFTEVYNAYVKDVYRYAYSRLNNQTESEDITSETFLKALEKLETFQIQDGKSIKCWLFTIARNLIFDKYRKKETVEFNDEITAYSDENILEKAVNRDMISRVEHFIKQFNPPVPEIIQLRIWEELSFDEISIVMGKPVGAIKMAYYRALEKIHVEFIKEGATINGK